MLITGDGTVKVTDFGIAKSVSDLSLTDAGMALGTAHYFSPEQAKGERVGPQADIYSLGVTLYEMLTGQTAIRERELGGPGLQAHQRGSPFASCPQPEYTPPP